jgi:hypothetical protein
MSHAGRAIVVVDMLNERGFGQPQQRVSLDCFACSSVAWSLLSQPHGESGDKEKPTHATKNQ